MENTLKILSLSKIFLDLYNLSLPLERIEPLKGFLLIRLATTLCFLVSWSLPPEHFYSIRWLLDVSPRPIMFTI